MKSIDSPGTRPAPAKINVRLEILGVRSDGFHEVRTIMCPIGLFDEVTIGPAQAGITVTTNRDDIPLDSRNVAYQAAALFADRAGVSRGIAIHLEKSIPVGAGLGGGSSDAAAVLLLLNELAGTGYSQADLMKMGESLGSDVPFFFGGGPALATGRGERLAPMHLSPAFWVALVMPSFSVSTAWAYAEHRHSGKRALFPLEKEIDLQALGPAVLVNDLERPVGGRFSEIGAIKEALIGCGSWGALMSGSGSTVFGIFFQKGQALTARSRLKANYAGRDWRVAVVPALL